MKAKSIFILVIVLVMATVMLVPHNAVFAGTNGQQLVVTVPVGSNVSVTGYNQNGQWVTHTWHTGQWTGNGWQFNAIITYGWWWVGNVTIRVAGGRTCTAFVPRYQNLDYYNVYCR